MYKPSNKAAVAAIALAAGTAVFAGGAGAQASGLIGSAQIKDGSILSRHIHQGTIRMGDLAPGAIANLQGDKGDQGAPGKNGVDGKNGAPGQNGKDGKDGKDALLGAYYSVAYYDVGDTNQGAIASVACKAQTDVAISGGVQVLGLGTGKDTPVSSSFPGRMDWSTNTPKADRLDGWIVQFAGATPSDAPEKTKIWALCVPGASVSVEQTYTESN